MSFTGAYGKEGSLTLPGGLTIKASEFTIDGANQVVPTSGFGDGGDSYHEAGLHAWSGNARAYLSGSPTADTAYQTLMTGTVEGTGVATFGFGGGLTATGAIIYEQIAPALSHKGGVGGVAISFQGIGPLG